MKFLVTRPNFGVNRSKVKVTLAQMYTAKCAITQSSVDTSTS